MPASEADTEHAARKTSSSSAAYQQPRPQEHPSLTPPRNLATTAQRQPRLALCRAARIVSSRWQAVVHKKCSLADCRLERSREPLLANVVLSLF